MAESVRSSLKRIGLDKPETTYCDPSLADLADACHQDTQSAEMMAGDMIVFWVVQVVLAKPLIAYVNVKSVMLLKKLKVRDWKSLSVQLKKLIMIRCIDRFRQSKAAVDGLM
ncbi:hypothetical protein [Streptococcus halotolerans]|uniref:hypothetical protein n=1 Tax=Streptococcus halotolerans TaxID=1814128 RepID=UPI000787F2ED|nr:hypothetical protein [Streptococcus halotolerans]